MKKIASKGFTVEAVSWENDGDNYQTRTMTVDSLEEAKAVKHMCDNLFQSRNSNTSCKAIGNMTDYDYDEVKWVAAQYLAVNPDLLKIKGVFDEQQLQLDVEKEYHTELDCSDLGWEDLLEEYVETREDLINKWWCVVADYNVKLLGYSEYLISRVCESTEITYLAEDVYAEVIL